MDSGTKEIAAIRPKVIGLGLSRTGTTSLFHILEDLGYEGSHFVSELFPPADWEKVADLDTLIDAPVPLYFEEIDQRFPGCKFILTTRELDSWLNSMKWMFTHGKVIWNWGPRVQDYHKKIYGTSKFNESALRKSYLSYHQRVSDYFRDRPQDLLTINISEGFTTVPICKFLGLPKSEITPHWTNSKVNASLTRRIKYAIKEKLGLLS